MSNVFDYDSQDGLPSHPHQETHWPQLLPVYIRETNTWIYLIFIQTPSDEPYIHIAVAFYMSYWIH